MEEGFFGPPNTSKSRMIIAMANFLQYDIYNLDFAIVEDNWGDYLWRYHRNQLL